MAVLTVFQASDGRVFLNRNDALAYDAALLRRGRVLAHLKLHRPFLTDTGRLKDTVNINDVVDCLVADALVMRTQVLI